MTTRTIPARLREASARIHDTHPEEAALMNEAAEHIEERARIAACRPEGAPLPAYKPYTGPSAEELEAMPRHAIADTSPKDALLLYMANLLHEHRHRLFPGNPVGDKLGGLIHDAETSGSKVPK